MSRVLPVGMAAEINASGSAPALSVISSNWMVIPQLLADTLVATDSNYKTRVCVATTGTVIVSLVDTTVSPSAVKIRRITAVGTPAQWTAAPTTIATGCTPLAGARCFAIAGTIRCCYQRAADLFPVYRDSADDGVTWGAETVLGNGTLPLALGNFVDDFYAIGIAKVWVICRSSGPLLTGASGMARTTFAAGVWSAWTIEQPTGGQGQIRSIDFIPTDGTNPAGGGIFVGGVQRRNTITGISLGHWPWNGAAQGAMSYIVQNDNPSSGITYTAAAAGQAKDATTTQYVLGCLIDDGSVSTNAHRRATLFSRAGNDTTDLHWRELSQLPQNAVSPSGSAMCLIGSLLYVITGKAVYTINVGQVNATTDLSADVLGLHVTEALSSPTRSTLTLSNINDQYSATLWATQSLTIALGYAGQTLLCWTCYVEDFRILYVGDIATVQLDLIDSSLFLSRIYTRLQAIGASTVSALLQLIAAQAGIPTTMDTTSPFSQIVPCFIIKPGDTPQDCLNRLADLYDLAFRITGTPSVTVLDLASRVADPSTWSYGSEALALAIGTTVDQPTVIRVVGNTATAWSEIQDDSTIAADGQVVYQHIADRLITTAAAALTRAQQALRTEQRAVGHAQLTVTINPQLEVMDVVDLTDSRLALVNQKYRIEAIDTHVDWQAGTWQQALTLANP